MQYKFLSAALIASAAAYPGILSDNELLKDIGHKIQSRAVTSETEDNCGFVGCGNVFDAQDQFIDVRPGSGHEFIAPRAADPVDLRGPCPGLNAAANHGFASRTGVFDLDDTVNGLFKAYSVGRDITPVLFVFAVFNSGSLVDAKWSIGGPFTSSTLGLLGPGLGISNSHNKYEGDASTGRGDCFLHNGDAHSLNIPNYSKLIAHATADGTDNFDFVKMRKHLVEAHEFTIANNPYGFFSPFSFFVPPIAHEFVTAMMSNHSAEIPGGVLPKHILNSFFAVKEPKKGTYEWIRGHDRIPYNWYKRPSSRPYDAAAIGADFALSIVEHPQIGDVGGNTGTPNSFVGLDLSDLTGGAMSSADLLKGNNLQCYIIQAFIGGVPDLASKLGSLTDGFFGLADKIIGNRKAELGCPQFQIDDSKLSKYPGYTLNQPEQPATPY